MRFTASRALVVILALAPLAVASPRTPIRATALSHEVATRGAKATVARLNHGSGAAWRRVLRSVASGREDWLALAPSLRAGTDAGTGEALTAAIAEALPRNPIRVLKLAGADFPLSAICAPPFIEPAPGQAEAWTRATLEALDTVRDPRLASIAADCRAVARTP